MKKALSIILTVTMLLSILTVAPFTVSAAETEAEQTVGASSGITGDCTWTLDNNGVLTISGNGAMEDYYYSAGPWRTNIKTVIIENGVTSIGDWAFFDCERLNSVTIPDSVTIIGEYAFSCCSNLNSFIIPNSVKSISDDMFSGCANLTSVSIPDTVTNIGKCAFNNCSNLTSIIIPDSVISIGEAAFSTIDGSGLTSVTIGNSVTSIGHGAFNNCRLESVIIPDSVTSIEDDSFAYCDNLKSVIIGNSVTSIGICAFGSCENLTSVTIGESVTSIGVYAFGSCHSLTSVTIPDSVTSIGEGAFYFCFGIDTVNISDIGAWCAIDFASYESNPLNYSSSAQLYLNGDPVTDLVIPDSVTKINDYAFYGCSGIESVTVPDSVTSIGNDAFSGTAWYNNQPDGLVYTGKVAYKMKGDCPSDITIENGSIGIADEAFKDCTSLTTVNVPDSVTNIGENAFSGTAWLNNQPDGVVYAGKLA